mmetsp:Transcript_2905/g.6848  ORF Transcript_2905/g.6848 Transcript_2905/m.6848 type:complete len:254 (+) Transcript_2905:98-859(+)|eukprot:CAMPEP_0116078054 /NCGR_PEP_ID=MMETSP0327-20121206/396_1 /TAXON_ID=44447 /ORGANISM="Pseudo-nitzschia delicatissima, Strain B596" /LENGTH=253 /DNA_ID=CAMNT_0003568571 /DNA_START=21 /DNA_END=782 /DNA_ORIENTATION=+
MSRFVSIVLSLLIGAVASVHAWTSAWVPASRRSISTSLCMTQQHPEQQQLRRDFLGASFAAATTAVLFPPGASFASYIDPVTDPPKITKKVYLDVEIGSKDDEKGRLVIGLFGDLMPKTVSNFESLCASNAYAGTSFYRVISDQNIQGGAVGDSTGKTGLSSFEGGKPFEPDNFNLKHTQAGLVSMVRGIGGSVDSRFFVNTKDEAGWADDRYAAFGIVQEGMDLVSKIEQVPVAPPKNAPKSEVKIVASGVL